MALLAQSKGASADLIGGYIVSYEKGEKPISSLFSFVGLSDRPKIHQLKSQAIKNLSGDDKSDIDKDSDPRKSRMILCWRGLSSSEDTDLIEKEFSSYTSDLAKALVEQDLREVEWFLAPTIYRCAKINEKHRYRDRVKLLKLVLGIIVAVFVMIFVLLRN
jgi:hypothetical protein